MKKYFLIVCYALLTLSGPSDAVVNKAQTGLLKTGARDFPGEPASARDTVSVPGLGRSHMPHGNVARAPQLLKPACLTACALQQEKSPQWEALTPQLESSPSPSNKDTERSKTKK